MKALRHKVRALGCELEVTDDRLFHLYTLEVLAPEGKRFKADAIHSMVLEANLTFGETRIETQSGMLDRLIEEGELENCPTDCPCKER